MQKVKHLNQLELVQKRLENLTPSSPRPAFDNLRMIAKDRRVLLAEDNTINRKVMFKMLIGLGFNNVDVATDGNEAVQMATRSLPPYDIILMDVNMPFLDGVQATQAIRAAGLSIPILAMTANALKGQAESYIAKGMTGYIAKPVDRRLLVDQLLSCLGQDTAS